jgi:flavorubredoxin
MKVRVVYESHWGNTAAVARAIAEGIGPDARALTTDEVPAADVADADLIVAGAPVIAFGLPSEATVNRLTAETSMAPAPPDLSHAPMRTWLATVEPDPAHRRRFAAFETAVRWSPGGATGAIEKSLEAAGFEPLSKSRRFRVHGKYGPLNDGELDKARAWGAELARALTT